jgi:hypothetical protein
MSGVTARPRARRWTEYGASHSPSAGRTLPVQSAYRAASGRRQLRAG